MPINFRKTRFLGVAAEPAQCPPPNKPEIVLSGRSNVGKSSLINTLGDNWTLARISTTPGKTRLIVYFDIDDRILLTDLPGYGYAKISQQVKATFSALTDSYLTSGRPVSLVLHLLDIRHAPSAEDMQMLDWLDSSGIPYLIVLTKADKLSRAQSLQKRAEIAGCLGIEDPSALLVFSAPDRKGVEELRQRIAAVFQDTAV
jgi:GTP-binding protein